MKPRERRGPGLGLSELPAHPCRRRPHAGLCGCSQAPGGEEGAQGTTWPPRVDLPPAPSLPHLLTPGPRAGHGHGHRSGPQLGGRRCPPSSPRGRPCRRQAPSGPGSPPEAPGTAQEAQAPGGPRRGGAGPPRAGPSGVPGTECGRGQAREPGSRTLILPLPSSVPCSSRSLPGQRLTLVPFLTSIFPQGYVFIQFFLEGEERERNINC